MKMLLVPTPLFNTNMGVDYYYFQYQKDGNALLTMPIQAYDGTPHPPLLDVINKVGLDALTTGKPLFVPISHLSLLADLENQCKVPAEKIIFVLGSQTPAKSTFIAHIARLKNQGYRFAADSKVNLQKQFDIVRFCDFVFMDAKSPALKTIWAFLSVNHLDLTVIPAGISSNKEFETAKKNGFSLFDGPFYRLPMSKGQNKVSPMKINYINLLNIARNEDFDIEKVSGTVQRDPALSISLLKMVNSLGLRDKVQSIEFATALIGQKELRKWISAVVSEMLAADKPNEITKMSLIRAQFAENMSIKIGLAGKSQSFFLMGLFSALDIILDMDMEHALNVVQVADEIRDALLYQKGDLYPVLELILLYEKADWINTSRSLIIEEISSPDVFDAYMDALQWYNKLNATLTENGL